jgi:flagellar motor switch protein FliG
MANELAKVDAAVNMPPAFATDKPDVLERAIAATNDGQVGATLHHALGHDQKAAIIVRLLLGPKGDLPLIGLDTMTTARLVRATASLSFVDESTILAVIQDFLTEIDSLSLYFHPGLEGAIDTLGSLITDDVTARLSFTPSSDVPDDPWISIADMTVDALATMLKNEAPQVNAIVLSRLSATKSAEILTELPDQLAQAATQAALEIGRVEMTAMNKIGLAIADTLHAAADLGALAGDPVDRVGSMLNYAPGSAREAMLSVLEANDPRLADQLRKIMFTFGDIPDRIEVKDVPKLVRAVDNDTLVRALAGAANIEKETVDFIFANLSKRLSEQLAEEVREVGDVKTKDADEAMNAVVQGIRQLEEEGKIMMIIGEE